MRPVPNPYEPAWPVGSKGHSEKQREILSQWRADSKTRGRHTEAEEEIKRLRDQGALFAVSHSGGKDSQAMMIAVRKLVPDEQILVIHAPLRHIEWEGSAQAAKKDTPKGSPFLLAEKYDNVGEEVWLLERVVEKCMWPSLGARWCTGEWKGQPISRELGRYADEHGWDIVVEAWGLRAEESPKRALQPPIIEHHRHGKKSMVTGKIRQWYIWLPIKWATTDEVFDSIKQAGKKPLWTYQQGMQRASCAFCVLASRGDLQVAARLAPDLYALYVAVEHYTNWCQQRRWEEFGPSRKGWFPTKPESRRPAKPDPGTIKRGPGNTARFLQEYTGLIADPKLVKEFYDAIQRTGDLREISLPSQVKRLPAKRLKQLRTFVEHRSTKAQMELDIPVGVWA
jgi:3'-phosphoadenosine 5'-phosphosulfate sulfotransferase (PAPS reductase)/FAD synthetase